MSATSYSYTTISAGPGEPTRVGVSFYLDRHAVTRFLVAEGQPFLSVAHGDVPCGSARAPRA